VKYPLLVLISCLLLTGCPPKNSILYSRSLNSVEAGYVADKSTDRLLKSDEAVDKMSLKVIDTLEEQGFELAQNGVSFGLQPFTGHTRDLIFHAPGNYRVRGVVRISKKEFLAEFEELETEHKSGIYNTTPKELEMIRLSIEALSKLARESYSGRMVKVSNYIVEISPNKSN